MEITDIREKAHRVCVDYLGGIWTSLKPEEIVIEKVHGGFINYMFKLSLPQDFQPISNEPKQVLMRNFSDKLKLGQFAIMTENIIVTLLGGEKLAPKVYGIFDGGRLDEFFESRLLKANDFNDPKILENVLKNLARLHCLKFPTNKNARQTYEKFESVLENIFSMNASEKFKNNPTLYNVFERFLSLKPQEEFEWLKNLRNSCNSPIVLSHNDFHLNNMLLLNSAVDSSDDRIRFVDYELCGYNYRGTDLSKLLSCFCIEMLPEPPFLNLNWDKFPTEEKQKEMFKIYLNEIKRQTSCKVQVDEEAVNQLVEEVKLFTLIGHFLIITFAFLNPIDMNVKIDLSSYADMIIDIYLREKKKVLNSSKK